MYVVVEGGKKISMPRYYKDIIYSPEIRSEIAGYQKGEMEKKELEWYNDSAYAKNEWDKSQAVQAAFNKMRIAAEKNRNKI